MSPAQYSSIDDIASAGHLTRVQPNAQPPASPSGGQPNLIHNQLTPGVTFDQADSSASLTSSPEGLVDRPLDANDTMYHGRSTKSRVKAAQTKREGVPLQTRRSTRAKNPAAPPDPPKPTPSSRKRNNSSNRAGAPSKRPRKSANTTSSVDHKADVIQDDNHSACSDGSDAILDKYDFNDTFIDDSQAPTSAMEGVQVAGLDDGHDSDGSFYVDESGGNISNPTLSDTPPPLESSPDPSTSMVAMQHRNAAATTDSTESDLFESFLAKLRKEPAVFFALADRFFKNESSSQRTAAPALASPFTMSNSLYSSVGQARTSLVQTQETSASTVAPSQVGDRSFHSPRTPQRPTAASRSTIASQIMTTTDGPSPSDVHENAPALSAAVSMQSSIVSPVTPQRSISNAPPLSMKDMVRNNSPGSGPSPSRSTGSGSFQKCTRLPSKCEVNNPKLYDPLLAETYSNLPPLRPGTLIPWSGFPGPGNCTFSAWGDQCPNMAGQMAMSALLFVMCQDLINPSRASPLAVHLRQVRTKQNTRLNVYRGDKPMIGVSCGFVTESQLLTPADTGLRQKYLRMILHTQEWERFTSWACMVFGYNALHAQLAADALEFQTRPLYNNNGDDTQTTTVASGMFRSSKGSTSAGTGKPRAFGDPMSLGPDDDVPIYDARNTVFNFETDLPKLATMLPRWQGEVPHGSFAVVGYCLAVHQPLLKKTLNLKCYIRWVILLGVPDGDLALEMADENDFE
ncbi:hypothetical protein BJ165DRAFT_1567409 [Panaeolus papilionaceus]|nr:hypothetical protein BJ165DRAFT_1567409 [Panaeolus papilionaceus]